MSSPVVLIIGAGARVGAATADTFASAGYRVAVSSRTNKGANDKHQHFEFDATKPETMPDLFSRVHKALGIPQVVIYNAVAHEDHSTDPFSMSIDLFSKEMQVNATSVYAAAREAVAGFTTLHNDGKLGKEGGTFIFTGNALIQTAAPSFMVFAAQKGASALMMKQLAQVEFMDQPFKFYFGDQRNENGMPMFVGLDGDAHAQHYLTLARDPKQGPWYSTFTKEKGYVKFPVVESFVYGKEEWPAM